MKKETCTCLPDETTGSTEFTHGVLSCNICGKEVGKMKMLILKRPGNLLFDTENPYECKSIVTFNRDMISPLNSAKTEWDFLHDLFPSDSQIFDNFGSSFFYRFKNLKQNG